MNRLGWLFLVLVGFCVCEAGSRKGGSSASVCSLGAGFVCLCLVRGWSGMGWGCFFPNRSGSFLSDFVSVRWGENGQLVFVCVSGFARSFWSLEDLV